MFRFVFLSTHTQTWKRKVFGRLTLCLEKVSKRFLGSRYNTAASSLPPAVGDIIIWSRHRSVNADWLRDAVFCPWRDRAEEGWVALIENQEPKPTCKVNLTTQTLNRRPRRESHELTCFHHHVNASALRKRCDLNVFEMSFTFPSPLFEAWPNPRLLVNLVH